MSEKNDIKSVENTEKQTRVSKLMIRREIQDRLLSGESPFQSYSYLLNERDYSSDKAEEIVKDAQENMAEVKSRVDLDSDSLISEQLYAAATMALQEGDVKNYISALTKIQDIQKALEVTRGDKANAGVDIVLDLFKKAPEDSIDLEEGEDG